TEGPDATANMYSAVNATVARSPPGQASGSGAGSIVGEKSACFTTLSGCCSSIAAAALRASTDACTTSSGLFGSGGSPFDGGRTSVTISRVVFSPDLARFDGDRTSATTSSVIVSPASALAMTSSAAALLQGATSA